MIDTHIHLDDAQYDADREEVISRFFNNGGEAIINVGSGIGSSQRSLDLAEKNDKIFTTVGLHPHYFMKHETFGSEYREKLKKLAGSEKVVAIGEVGLDYYFPEGTPKKEEEENFKRRQKSGFLFQLDLAKELDLPLAIHCREAYEDVYEMLDKDRSTVFHCYGGSVEFTKKLLEHKKIFFSFTGNITYAKPGAEIFEVIRLIPLERIMVETDGPYLTPAPFRGKRNEPAYTQYVIEKVAEIKEIDAIEVEKKTSENARIFFNLKKNKNS